jgi:hypothetical protein
MLFRGRRKRWKMLKKKERKGRENEKIGRSRNDVPREGEGGERYRFC